MIKTDQHSPSLREIAEKISASKKSCELYVLMSKAALKVESQFMVPLRFSIYEGTINVFVHEYHSVYRKNVADLVNELSEIDEEHRKVNVLSDQLITFFINGERLEHALDA